MILALVSLIYIDGSDMSGLREDLARTGIPLAAILMPAGFFFSSAGRDRVSPNRFIALLYTGVLSLSVGVAALGIGLLGS